MVTDKQVRRLMKLIRKGKALATAAAGAGMDEKTARKYRELGMLPSEWRAEHTWRTRPDPFADVWDEVSSRLEVNSGLQAKTLFDDLQRRYPGEFADGQLRTLQRKIKSWRATDGPAREVFFPQEHHPGVLCASDFCFMTSLGITIQRQAFPHLLYHFVLTYSNWETGTVCYSESFESLSQGLQNALFELGGVPQRHRTDRMSAAVQKPESPDEFTRRYEALLSDYALVPERTQAGRAHENGDVEQSHYRIKEAVDQSLMLRGSKDFVSREDYLAFLRRVFEQRNAGRSSRLAEELRVLRPLPPRRLESFTRLDVRVGPSSTIRVKHNTYSVASRLIGEMVQVRLHPEHLEVWYGQRLVERLPRLRGENRHRIHYRHVIDWLVRKPGAFEGYRYRDDLFPTSRFRMAYDALRETNLHQADREYLKILHLAARETETGVDDALRLLFASDDPIAASAVEGIVRSGQTVPPPTELAIPAVDLSEYDSLLAGCVASREALVEAR
jgi:hypothetical protein